MVIVIGLLLGVVGVGRPVEKLVVLRSIADQGILLREARHGLRRHRRGLDFRERLLEDAVGDEADLLGGPDAALERELARLLDDARGVLLGDADDAPHTLLADTSLRLEELAAQLVGARADGFGLCEQERCLARRIERALVVRQAQGARRRGPGVAPDQRLSTEISDLDLKFVDAHEDHASGRSRACGVAGSVHRDRRVVVDGARPLLKVPERRQGEFDEMGFLLLEHRLNLALGPPVDAGSRPLLLPVQEKRVLVLDRLEAAAHESRALGVLDRVLDGPLAVGVTDAGRVGGDAVVREHRRVQAIELGLVEVGRDDTLLEVVEDHVLRAASEVPERLLVQAAPRLLARLPDNLAEAPPRIPERHHEEPRPAVAAGARVERRCALAVVHLRLLAGQELEPVELLGVAAPEGPDESLDAVVSGREAVLVDEILVDRVGVALEPHLGLDPLPVRLAGRARVRRDRAGVHRG